MKILYFKKDGVSGYGVISGNRVFPAEGDVFTRYRISDRSYHLSEIDILPPCTPSKIIAVGLNYRSHAEELGMTLPDEPLIFLKPPTAVIGHDKEIVYPAMSQRIDYEAELGIVIGKTCRNCPAEEAPGYILGYTCFNDVTARDLQQKDVQFTRSKSFDTFAPIGPHIETELDLDSVVVEGFLNGIKKQSAPLSDLIFPVNRIVSFISNIMTLLPGDVIATGTPSGIGPMAPGDTIEIRISGIGALKNRVSRKADR